MTTKMQSKQVSLRLTPEKLAQLEAMCQTRGMSMNDLVTDLVLIALADLHKSRPTLNDTLQYRGERRYTRNKVV